MWTTTSSVSTPHCWTPPTSSWTTTSSNARGFALFNANARVTKNFSLSQTQKVSVFIELYNLTDRANFGNSIGANAATPATYGKPIGYPGGIGAVSTIPNSFQMQFGARYMF
jgi:hypothetical protein